MRTKPNPEQGFRSYLGILSLARGYGLVRLEAACRRGIAIGAMSYRSAASILKNGLDAGNETRPPSIGTSGRVQSESPAAIIGIRNLAA
jgi:hypothetical protein